MGTVNRIPAEVFPPGDFIKDELEAREWTQADLAAILRKPLPAVNELIVGKKSITPATAKGLGDAFGTGAEFWLNLETSYRLAIEAPVDEDVARRAKMYTVSPVKELDRRGWIARPGDTKALESDILSFYRVSSLDEIQTQRIAARKSGSYDETTPLEWAWYCRAVQMAESLHVGSYDEEKFRSEGLRELHRLTSSEQEIRTVPRLLAEYGIRFVVLERLQKMTVDGVAFWTGENKPAIAVSMRADRIDGFWFTLAHEICHVLRRDIPTLDEKLVGKDRQPTDEKPEVERTADLFAAEFLIPPEEIERFIIRVKPLYSKVRINQFAGRIGVHPGIVVGQLQHRREIDWTHSREMLVKVREILTHTALYDGWDSIPESEK